MKDAMKFSSISDLKPDKSGVTNIIAVVINPTSRVRTSGDVFLCRLDLIDSSCSSILVCMLFGTEASLPEPESISAPCIVKMESVKVQYFAGRPQLNKGDYYSFSFYAAFVDAFDYIHKSPNSDGVLLAAEKEQVEKLRLWLASPDFSNLSFGSNFVKKGPLQLAEKFEDPKSEQAFRDYQKISKNQVLIAPKFNKFSDYPIPLEAMVTDLYFNLKVQILGFCYSNNCYVLRCCDGTVPEVTTVKVPTKLLTSSLSLDTLNQLSRYSVDICIYDDHIKTVQVLKPGEVIYFTNLHCYTPAGLPTPEVILHGGAAYKRGVKVVKPDSDSAIELINRVDKITITKRTSESEVKSLPEDVPRSVQSSPTECFYPEQNLTELKTILQNRADKGLYKVRVYVLGHMPELYGNMLQKSCNACGAIQLDDAPLQCCTQPVTSLTIFCKLLIKDASVREVCELICGGKELVGVSEVLASADLVKLERIVEKWCDLHVLCRVLPGSGDTVKLFLTHTIIKDDCELPIFV